MSLFTLMNFFGLFGGPFILVITRFLGDRLDAGCVMLTETLVRIRGVHLSSADGGLAFLALRTRQGLVRVHPPGVRDHSGPLHRGLATKFLAQRPTTLVSRAPACRLDGSWQVREDGFTI